MYGNSFGDVIDGIYKFVLISTFIAWPLAIWKLIELVFWIFDHINVVWV